jgi:hypothetical protein
MSVVVTLCVEGRGGIVDAQFDFHAGGGFVISTPSLLAVRGLRWRL